MCKVVIKISQGSVVTQTVLDGLTIHLPVANFLCFISAKNYENWLESGQSYCNEHRVQFFWPTLYMLLIVRHKYLLKQFLVNIDSFGGCWTWHP